LDIKHLFGQRVIFLRKKKRLSQKNLANKAKLDVSLIAAIELGKCSPSIDLAAKIAMALNVEISALFVTFKD